MDKLVNKSSLREEKEASLMDKLINHPHFKEGEKVSFRINDTVSGIGKIRGLASQNIIDTWIVEVIDANGIDSNVYGYSCIVVPHTLIVPLCPKYTIDGLK